ncbi:hypothetical protein [Actinoplanes xinjiangensis]|uniref:hypothetical protein n=1 Tax=Actinoplanes xinjiangensis TaxID=512350 RepID=UPI0034479311
MTATVAFIVFFVGALLIAAVTGLLASRLRSSAIGIVCMTAGAFVTTLTLSMTSYQFLN